MSVDTNNDMSHFVGSNSYGCHRAVAVSAFGKIDNASSRVIVVAQVSFYTPDGYSVYPIRPQ